jgi:glycosyltransferase involved in cell wall biosynthesis
MQATDVTRVSDPDSVDTRGAVTATQPADKYSILHVAAPGETGGLESVVRSLAAAQRRHGHSVAVAAIIESTEAARHWQDALRASDLEVVRLVYPGRHYVAEWRAVTELYRRRRPAVVHTHGYHADVVAGLAARRAGLPTVTTVHGFTGGGWKNRLYERVQRQAFRRFSAVIAVSRAIASDLERDGVPANRVHVVQNGLARDAEPLPRAEARRALGIGGAERRIGWIGRLSAEKGPDVMIAALAVLPHDVRLSILGGGAGRSALERLARRLGVADRITWHGVVPDAANLVTAFDVVALSSRAEGTPIVLLEAMAAGTPIVATRVGGVPEVVSDREALLVDADSPRALAGAVAATLGDPVAATARAAAAGRRVEQSFGIGLWLGRVDAVYEAAMRNARASDVR